MIRERRIKAGKLLEADFYPVYPSGRRIPERAARSKPTSDEMKRYNAEQARRRLIELVNANFDDGDIFFTATISPSAAPSDVDEARKIMVNYIRRVKRRRAKLGITEPFKYIYIIEAKTYKTGKNKGKTSYHFHAVMSRGLSRDDMENMWTAGERVSADRYLPSRFGYETLAKYFSKDPEGTRRYFTSKNLTQPIRLKDKDGRISRRTVERMATIHIDDADYWQHKYPGYRFLRCNSRYNEFNGHWYVSAVMVRM